MWRERTCRAGCNHDALFFTTERAHDTRTMTAAASAAHQALTPYARSGGHACRRERVAAGACASRRGCAPTPASPPYTRTPRTAASRALRLGRLAFRSHVDLLPLVRALLFVDHIQNVVIEDLPRRARDGSDGGWTRKKIAPPPLPPAGNLACQHWSCDCRWLCPATPHICSGIPAPRAGEEGVARAF